MAAPRVRGYACQNATNTRITTHTSAPPKHNHAQELHLATPPTKAKGRLPKETALHGEKA